MFCLSYFIRTFESIDREMQAAKKFNWCIWRSRVQSEDKPKNTQVPVTDVTCLKGEAHSPFEEGSTFRNTIDTREWSESSQPNSCDILFFSCTDLLWLLSGKLKQKRHFDSERDSWIFWAIIVKEGVENIKLRRYTKGNNN